jgi:hypothetical protein
MSSTSFSIAHFLWASAPLWTSVDIAPCAPFMVYTDCMKEEEKATAHLRIYPSTHEALRRMALKRSLKKKVSIAEVIHQLVKGV